MTELFSGGGERERERERERIYFSDCVTLYYLVCLGKRWLLHCFMFIYVCFVFFALFPVFSSPSDASLLSLAVLKCYLAGKARAGKDEA